MEDTDFNSILSTLDEGYDSLLFKYDITLSQLNALKQKIQEQDIKLSQIIIFKYTCNIESFIISLMPNEVTVFCAENGDVLANRFQGNVTDFNSFIFEDTIATSLRLVVWDSRHIVLQIPDTQNGFSKASFKLLMNEVRKGYLPHIHFDLVKDIDNDLLDDFLYTLKSCSLKNSLVGFRTDIDYNIRLTEALCYPQVKLGILSLTLNENATKYNLSKFINPYVKFKFLNIAFNNEQNNLEAYLNLLSNNFEEFKPKFKGVFICNNNIFIPLPSNLFTSFLDCFMHSEIEILNISNFTDTDELINKLINIVSESGIHFLKPLKELQIHNSFINLDNQIKLLHALKSPKQTLTKISIENLFKMQLLIDIDNSNLIFNDFKQAVFFEFNSEPFNKNLKDISIRVLDISNTEDPFPNEKEFKSLLNSAAIEKSQVIYLNNVITPNYKFLEPTAVFVAKKKYFIPKMQNSNFFYQQLKNYASYFEDVKYIIKHEFCLKKYQEDPKLKKIVCDYYYQYNNILKPIFDPAFEGSLPAILDNHFNKENESMKVLPKLYKSLVHNQNTLFTSLPIEVRNIITEFLIYSDQGLIPQDKVSPKPCELSCFDPIEVAGDYFDSLNYSYF
ncbi:MAG: hypothetical protein K0R02_47 [Rickettsiaceae bacterium]|jgi:hypothetical protein|nr:hypothetical protein [Rickettsiaceae bacterium]